MKWFGVRSLLRYLVCPVLANSFDLALLYFRRYDSPSEWNRTIPSELQMTESVVVKVFLINFSMCDIIEAIRAFFRR